MQTVRRADRPRGPRPGFTLIELLMVVIIISILIALILPAVMAARITALESGVKMELSGYEQAIGLFKQKYGVEPPSRIVICEKASDWSGGAATAINTDRLNQANRQRSVALLRRMWPQFNFGLDRDINGDGSLTVLDINAGECLVFFLAAPRWNAATSQFEALGFSKNPANPFAVGGNRDVPQLEFKVDRFTDLDGDKIPEYLDSYPGQQTPLLYFSANEGKGYEGLDWNGTGMDNPAVNEVTQNTDDDGPYHLPPASSATVKPGPYHKAQSFQIISPGGDGQFGYGGVFDPNNIETSLGTVATSPRAQEWDNITNFHPGRLKP